MNPNGMSRWVIVPRKASLTRSTGEQSKWGMRIHADASMRALKVNLGRQHWQLAVAAPGARWLS